MTTLSRSIALQGIGFKHPFVALQGFRYTSNNVVPSYIFVFKQPLVSGEVLSLKFGVTLSTQTTFNSSSAIRTGFINKDITTTLPVSNSTTIDTPIIADYTTKPVPVANSDYMKNKIEIISEVFLYEFK